jgi:hypothetical protein
MKRLSTVTGLFTIMLAAPSAAYAETPKAGAQPAPAPAPAAKPAAKPSAKPAATTPTSSTKKSKPRKRLLSPEDEKRMADLQQQAATFAELLTAEGENAPNRGGLSPLASGVGDNSAAPGQASTAKVCAMQPCPTAAPVSTVGTTSCTVRGIGTPIINAPAMQKKIRSVYNYSVRRCAAGKAQDTLIASKTTVTFTINETGRAVDISSTGTNTTVADCIGKGAVYWRFEADGNDIEGPLRVEVTLETKP